MTAPVKVKLPKLPVIYLSFGAGVQSTAMLILACQGKIAKPELAVFADTQDEPQYVYDHLQSMQLYSGSHGIPLEVTTAGKLSDEIYRIPAFTENGGLASRQCTSNFKITPIERHIRHHLGYKKGERIPKDSAIAQIGISLDEAHRMKPSQTKWILRSWPLIDLHMNRHDCELVIKKSGMKIPQKSACVFCPYHDNTYWRMMKEKHPQDFQKAVESDEKLRQVGSFGGGMKMKAFVHRSLVPLKDIDFADHNGQLFGEECEGICGV